MLEVATSFYKNIFGYEPKLNIHLSVGFGNPDDMVTGAENAALQKPFPQVEIKEATIRSYAHGSPYTYWHSFLFYQFFCDPIKRNLWPLSRT